MDSDETENRIG